MTVPDFVVPPGPHSIENRASDPRSSFEAVCDGMLARLKTELPGRVMVDHFPDQPESFDFQGYDAAVLVLYGGSRFEEAGLRGAQGTSELFTLHVVVLVHHLRPSAENPIGAYQLLADIRQALHGHSLAGCTGLRPIATELERRSDDGVFQYRIDFDTRLPSLPSRAGQVSLPRGFTTDRR